MLHWIVALMLVISPLQLTMADDFDAESHSDKCDMHTMHGSDIKQSDQCAMEHNEHCQDHPGCVAHFQSTSLVTSTSFLLYRTNVLLIKFATDEEKISTLYPSLPERPPKA